MKPLALTTIVVLSIVPFWAAEIHVSPMGDDAASGTADHPLATLARARDVARETKESMVVVHAGTYYLPETLRLTPADSGLTIRAADGETVILSGGTKLDLTWRPYRDGIMQAKTPEGMAIDQLFVNGQRLPMARYPNYDASVRPYGGFSADAFSPKRAARWSDPTGGFIHAMHRSHWGGYHYRITGKTPDGKITYEGGWQNNRQMGMHPQHRFVENIFEELDAPGEWFHNPKTSTLYLFPKPGTNLAKATVEAVRLRHLVEIHGTRAQPVRNITLRGFVFRHSARTFMDTKEPLLRSDWTIYRGGAVFFEGTEDCTLADSEFDQPGGNAVFANNYNRCLTIRTCHIHDAGASAVAFVGDPKAVRNPLFEYNQRQSYEEIDKTPGPKTDNYPADCLVEDCLIHGIGQIEKQTAGVQISMSARITVRHCSIYETSRAGINVSEGTFGGHLVEGCDVFDTVLETSDHGSFNSWGRDRFWGLTGVPAGALPKLARLDAAETTVLRRNRWRCDHGWDVDLDDGSSNYLIEQNLFLHGGLKLREGFFRTVRNNIAVNSTLNPHVWYPDSGDVVTQNIWMSAYKPAIMNRLKKWGTLIDRNFFTTTADDRDRFATHGCDAHSLVGDPMFVDPAAGDFRVKPDSPVLKLGFKNFPMDQFGVRSTNLRRIARTPTIPPLRKPGEVKDTSTPTTKTTHHWLQATIRNLSGTEFSAFGVSRESGGVHFSEVPADSPAARADLRTGDLLQKINGHPVRTIVELRRRVAAAKGHPLELTVIRSQQALTIHLTRYPVVATETAKSADGFSRIRPGAKPSPVTRITTHPATRNEAPDTLRDGRLANNYGPVFANGIRGGIYKADLGKSREVMSVSTWSYNLRNKRGPQRFALFGCNSESDPGWNIADRTRFTPLGEIETTGQPIDSFLATRLQMNDDSPLGHFRWLLWVVQPVTPIGENTAFQELGVEEQ